MTPTYNNSRRSHYLGRTEHQWTCLHSWRRYASSSRVLKLRLPPLFDLRQSIRVRSQRQQRKMSRQASGSARNQSREMLLRRLGRVVTLQLFLLLLLLHQQQHRHQQQQEEHQTTQLRW